MGIREKLQFTIITIYLKASNIRKVFLNIPLHIKGKERYVWARQMSLSQLDCLQVIIIAGIIKYCLSHYYNRVQFRAAYWWSSRQMGNAVGISTIYLNFITFNKSSKNWSILTFGVGFCGCNVRRNSSSRHGDWHTKPFWYVKFGFVR